MNNLLGTVAIIAILSGGQPTYAAPTDAVLFNGLMYPEMGTIGDAMTRRGQHVEILWHDQTPSSCPRYILGHSMGGIAALSRGAACAASGHPPRAIVTIDPTGYPGTLYCPKGVRCLNYYDPTHSIGGGARPVTGAVNVRMSGYTHLQLPSVPSVVRGALAITK